MQHMHAGMESLREASNIVHPVKVCTGVFRFGESYRFTKLDRRATVAHDSESERRRRLVMDLSN